MFFLTYFKSNLILYRLTSGVVSSSIEGLDMS